MHIRVCKIIYIYITFYRDNTFLFTFQTQQNQNSTPIKLNIGGTSGSQGNIQLVVDPRMGVILGPVTQTQGSKLLII